MKDEERVLEACGSCAPEAAVVRLLDAIRAEERERACEIVMRWHFGPGVEDADAILAACRAKCAEIREGP